MKYSKSFQIWRIETCAFNKNSIAQVRKSCVTARKDKEFNLNLIRVI